MQLKEKNQASYKSIYDTVTEELGILKNYMQMGYLQGLINIVENLANTGFSNDLQEILHDQISDLINILHNEDANLDACLAKESEILKLLTSLDHNAKEDFIMNLKYNTATALALQYLSDNNFIESIAKAQDLTDSAEQASSHYHPGKASPAQQERIEKIKAFFNYAINQEEIFSKELNYIKQLEEKFQVEIALSKMIEEAKNDFEKIPTYLQIALDFKPGIIDPPFRTNTHFNLDSHDELDGMVETCDTL